MTGSPLVSVVMPTYQRRGALEKSLPSVLSLANVDEIIIVVDGSSDGTLTYLSGVDDPRVRVETTHHVGSAAARNRGIYLARGLWVLMLDDDDIYPPDYATQLLVTARSNNADIVGAPWVKCRAGEESREVTRRREHPVDEVHLDTHPGQFPTVPVVTPFIPGTALFRRSLLRTVRYDESYRGNGWREETDLFLRASERGARIVLTPGTCSFHHEDSSGGQRQRSRLSYECWVIRNNWRFLRRHEATLRTSWRDQECWFGAGVFCCPPCRRGGAGGGSSPLRVLVAGLCGY